MILKLFFHLYLLNMDILLNIEVRYMKFLTELENILMQGTVSQIFDEGLSFYSMSKNG